MLAVVINSLSSDGALLRGRQINTQAVANQVYQGTETTHLEPQQEGDRLEEKQQPQPTSPQTGGKAAIWTQIPKDRDAASRKRQLQLCAECLDPTEWGKKGARPSNWKNDDHNVNRQTRFEGTGSVVTEGRYQWEVVVGRQMQA